MDKDQEFIHGARTLLEDFVGLSKGDSVLLIYDAAVESACKSVGDVATQQGIEVQAVSSSEDWTALVSKMVQHQGVVFFQVNKSYYSQELISFLKSGVSNVSVYRLFGATSETIRCGFRRKKETLRLRNWDLIIKARRARSLRVESDLGTDLKINVAPSAPWINTYGEFNGETPGILPPSEINTFSNDVNGVLVVDGAIGSNIDWPLDARLGDNPVTLRISDGKIMSVRCSAPLVQELIQEFLEVPNANQVVEVGIGTNDAIERFLSSDVLLNERTPSFHVGLGNSDAENEATRLHMDFILDHCRIFMGSEMVLNNRNFSPISISKVPKNSNSYEVPVFFSDAI